MFWKINIPDIKKWTPTIINNVWNIKHNLYLYYIRRKIYKAENPKDLICLLQTIASYHKSITTDELF